MHSISEVKRLKDIYANSDLIIKFLYQNPIDLFWDNQPKFPDSNSFIHDQKYAGESAIDKIKKIHNTFIDIFFNNINKGFIFDNKKDFKDFISIDKFCEIIKNWCKL